MHQKIVGLTPGQGTCLGCEFDPGPGAYRVGGGTRGLFLSHISVFLSLSFLSSLSKMNNKNTLWYFFYNFEKVIKYPMCKPHLIPINEESEGMGPSFQWFLKFPQ